MFFENSIDRLIAKIFGAVCLIAFALMNAAVSDSVSTYQLDAVYLCAIEFNEAEHKARCRNELDGFGHLLILPAEHYTHGND